MLVKPTKCFWPTTSRPSLFPPSASQMADDYSVSTANLFQALHFDNQMTSKRVRLFWTIFVVMFFWEIIPQCEYRAQCWPSTYYRS